MPRSPLVAVPNKMRLHLVVATLLLPVFVSAQLLEIFGLSTGDAGTKAGRQPFHDLARLTSSLSSLHPLL